MHERIDHRQRGFTFVEVVVSSAILILMVYTVVSLSISGRESQEYAARLNRATEINQEILDQIRLDMVSTVRIFGNDTVGNTHLGLFDISAYPPPLSTSRLPSVRVDGTLRADTAGDEQTGNQLFFVMHSWVDEYQCSSGRTYRVDVYRWQTYYPTAEGAGPRPDTPVGLNLVHVLSEPMVDGAQIDKIGDPIDQGEFLAHLANGTPDVVGEEHPPVEVVWLRSGDPTVSGTFRQIDPTDGSLSTSPFNGRPSPWMILPDGKHSRSSLLSYRHHSVGTIYARDSWGVGRFGLTDPSGDGFPHGFEVQVVGPSAARQLLLHSVVVSTNNHGHKAWSDIQIVVDTRDL